jgi:nicotinamidase-related amidase
VKKLLVVVDMQNDFVTGVLGTPEARAIVPTVVAKVKEYIESGNSILFTKDCHNGEFYLNTEEGKHLPIKHCIMGTDGIKIIPELAPYCADEVVYTKDRFASLNLSDDIHWRYISDEIESVEIIGVCTDICVISNAIVIATHVGLPITVDASCCAGTTPEMHSKALDVMRSCQIEITN